MRILIILALSLATQFATAQANYSKTVEVPPLRVSFLDLQAVLDKTEKLVASANSGIKPLREDVSMKAGVIQVTMPGHALSPTNVKFPDRIDSFTYTYLATGLSPITRVYFDFNDFRRTLTVEGSSPEQVDAIFSAAREDLTSISSGIGGSTIKALLGGPAYWLLMIVIGGSASAWYGSRSSKSLAVLLSSIAVIALLFLLPIEELLAGFMAIRGDPSLMVRYGPHMSFVGFLLAVAGVPITVMQMRKEKYSEKSMSAPMQNSASPAEDIPDAKAKNRGKRS